MNILATFADKFTAVTSRIVEMTVGTFGVIMSFVMLSIFATVGLFLIGISAVFLCIPLALGIIQPRNEQSDIIEQKS